MVEGMEDMVCKLNRSIYGLKQSPKIWGDQVKDFLISIGFQECVIDPCTYIRSSATDFSAIYLHVDNLAITGTGIEKVKSQIATQWEMEDLGVARSVVGIHISRLNSNCYFLNQLSLAMTILERFECQHLKISSTPLPVKSRLYKASEEESKAFALEKKPYRNGVGSLMYLSMCTRSDLSHAVGVLSQHVEHPGEPHWDALIHVFRYLKGTTHLGIKFDGSDPHTIIGQKSHHLPVSMCDADWAGDPNTRRSTTCYVFKLAGRSLSWKSCLQPTVALSSTEAEYRAITEAGQGLIWLRNMMKEYGYEDTQPTVLQRNNLSTIHLNTKSIFHGQTKHIKIQHHWIREVVNCLTLIHCPTSNMTADLMPKPFGKSHFLRLQNDLGLC